MEQKKEQSPLTPTFSLDDFFTTQEQRDEKKKEKVEEIDISLIDDFPNHPFKVIENEELKKLEDSISEHGILEPILVRPKKDGRFEIISGHRRKRASELIGKDKIRCIIKNLSFEEAVINMVDSNLHREKILPSEKAFAYKMKYDALKHQGRRVDLTSGPDGQKSTAEQIGNEQGESERTVRRYIRLTELIPELLELVDNSVSDLSPSIALSPAVEISYFKEEEQKILFEVINYSDATPSHDQAIRMRKLSSENKLNESEIIKIMEEEKPNQIAKFKIEESKLMSVIPKNINRNNIEDFVLKACSYYTKHLRQKDIERD